MPRLQVLATTTEIKSQGTHNPLSGLLTAFLTSADAPLVRRQAALLANIAAADIVYDEGCCKEGGGAGPQTAIYWKMGARRWTPSGNGELVPSS